MNLYDQYLEDLSSLYEAEVVLQSYQDIVQNDVLESHWVLPPPEEGELS